jgi:glycosyltransferase involved in cell wall biosynthesis
MLVSVVVAVLNSSASLKQLLESLEKQQCLVLFEVVIVDDGSSEPLAELVQGFRPQLDVSYIKLPVNQGPATARNAGINAAKGDIVLFTDADCRPANDWLQKMVAPFSDPEVAAVKGAYDSEQTDRWAQLAQLEFLERYELLASQSDIDFVDTYSGAYRKSDLLRVRGFNSGFTSADNEDVDLSFRIKKLGGRFVFVGDALVLHRHREGWLNYARLKFNRGFWRMKVYSDHPQKAGNDSYTPATLKLQLVLTSLLPVLLVFKRLRFFWKAAWLYSCLPLMRIALNYKPALLLFIPLFCLVRSLALLAGITAGLWRERDKYLRHWFRHESPQSADSSL